MNAWDLIPAHLLPLDRDKWPDVWRPNLRVVEVDTEYAQRDPLRVEGVVYQRVNSSEAE